MATYSPGASSRRPASILGAILAAGCLTALWACGLPSLQSLSSAGATVTLAIATDQSTSPPAAATDLTGRPALEKQLELLKTGRGKLSERAGYTCTLIMRERVGGELLPEDELQMTVRHNPFSIALNWPAEGRHVVYVEETNDDKMLVSMGGWQRILGRMKIDPHGERAMSKARYPITEAGLLKLTERLIGHCERDLGLKDGVRCTAQDRSSTDGRDCWCFVVEYDREIEPIYRRSIVHVDKELSVPISVRHDTWPDEPGSEDESLIEHYVYRDLDFSRELTEADFTVQRPRRAE